MDSKPQNVFDKLDKQDEKLDEISKKIEDVNIDDLYALAKRTWDTGDYITAQKYYNHISILRPLDWEAPLYASLCNFKGYHAIDFWITEPPQLERLYITTLNYIQNLTLDSASKEIEMTKCVKIIEKNISSCKEMYFDYKNDFDKYAPNYILNLEDSLVNVFYGVGDIDFNATKELRIYLADNLLEIIETIEKCSPKITQTILDELVDNCNNINKFKLLNKLKKIHLSQIKIEEVSFTDESTDIVSNGIKVFKYSDEVISNRRFKKAIITGTILLLSSLIGTIISILAQWQLIFVFIFPIIYGIILIIIAITQKDSIKCSSLLCNFRTKTRLSSSGEIVEEKCFNIIKILYYVSTYFAVFNIIAAFYVYVLVLENLHSNVIAIFTTIFTLLNSVVCFFNLNWLFDSLDLRAGNYYYIYKGKYYNI